MSSAGCNLALRGVTVRYGDVTPVRDVTLSATRGEFLGVIGRSGAGKTTLLRVSAGLVEPASGTVTRTGSARMVFQGGVLFPWLSAEGNIRIGLVATSKTEERLATLLEDFGLTHVRTHFPHQLSGGERQRVALACAWAGDPATVLMDEPFGALDTMTRQSMQEWLSRTWEAKRVTAVFVSHDIEEVLLLADRVVVLDHGRLCYELAVPFARPRDETLRESPDFVGLRRQLRLAIPPAEV